MPTWNDIRANAGHFADRWKDEARENAEAQTFWAEFLAVFGVERRRVASFEKRVDGLPTASGRGRIDMLWPGTFLAEHKTKGRDLEAATRQALEYVDALEPHERPQFVAVSDFGQIRLHEVETAQAFQFPLADLPRQVERFGFLIGKQLRHQRESDPVNVKAAQQMSRLHNLLEDSGYTGHPLQLLLVRLLFLLFADDTGLFDQRGLFQDVLEEQTRKDGQDTGSVLARLFQVLDTPRDRRQANLPAWLAAFPYVNGQLFAERLDLSDWSPHMRRLLLEAATLDWGAVSPAIFGSMFQAVMDETERRNLGAHYTSETNIMRTIRPLFLDDLQAQLDAARGSRTRLQAFLDMLPRLKFLDAACGSGNFLLLAYRELRRLELAALLELLELEGRAGQQLLDIRYRLKVSVEQFHGIEVDEFAAQVARVAMWLIDHQMNLHASAKLGQNIINLPLTHAAHIRHADALKVDWLEHLGLTQSAQDVAAVYFLGNPPFIGAHLLSADQRAQVVAELDGVTGSGKLDFVAAWYARAAKCMRYISTHWPHIKTAAALVSTNSVTQGEQVAPLWSAILNTYGQVITSAHQTFRWTNDAPGRAAVHVVVVQFQPARTAPSRRRLFTYSRPDADPIETEAGNLSPYLNAGPSVIVARRSQPLRPGVPPMLFGSKPVDGGHLILQDAAEHAELLKHEPAAAKFIHPLLDAQDFLNGGTRWVLWLKDATPADLAKLPEVRQRLERVKAMRQASKKEQTRRWADRPALFVEDRQPAAGHFLAVPSVSSERREYVPVGYLDAHTIANNLLYIVPDADLFTFGLIQSRAHMDWLRLVGGRLESRYRYASDVVYNTFPWPDRTTLKPAQVQAVERAAQAVLDARQPLLAAGNTLAQMYAPEAMGLAPDLLAAHKQLDRAVDALYSIKPADLTARRQAVLLEKYQQLLGDLEAQTPPKAAKRPRKAVGT